ncbi:hypothetical protein PYCCODRAFT_1436915 [Trametes coccinea BRFM310]|uniref:Uncharacterized protein n=1 Tax=Trametes coccinea (strain BRFM310) TaxID=1353009 RepID=A0A1Y2IKW5_TRAC3|nr:hypothetical protein PYCCODRAFT_1436915 [Trametes coccinea BRFM310]
MPSSDELRIHDVNCPRPSSPPGWTPRVRAPRSPTCDVSKRAYARPAECTANSIAAAFRPNACPSPGALTEYLG